MTEITIRSVPNNCFINHVINETGLCRIHLSDVILH